MFLIPSGASEGTPQSRSFAEMSLVDLPSTFNSGPNSRPGHGCPPPSIMTRTTSDDSPESPPCKGPLPSWALRARYQCSSFKHRMHRTNQSRWQHSHDYTHDSSVAERRTRVVIGITAGMMVVEIAAGIAFNSMALRWGRRLVVGRMTEQAPLRKASHP